MNINTLFYELGVMAFNALYNDTIQEQAYDMRENFLSIIGAVGMLSKESFRDGFIAESQNFNLTDTHAEELYLDCVKIIEDVHRLN